MPDLIYYGLAAAAIIAFLWWREHNTKVISKPLVIIPDGQGGTFQDILKNIEVGENGLFQLVTGDFTVPAIPSLNPEDGYVRYSHPKTFIDGDGGKIYCNVGLDGHQIVGFMGVGTAKQVNYVQRIQTLQSIIDELRAEIKTLQAGKIGYLKEIVGEAKNITKAGGVAHQTGDEAVEEEQGRYSYMPGRKY